MRPRRGQSDPRRYVGNAGCGARVRGTMVQEGQDDGILSFVMENDGEDRK